MKKTLIRINGIFLIFIAWFWILYPFAFSYDASDAHRAHVLKMEEHARFMDQMDIVLYSQWALRVNCRTDDYDEFQKHMTLIRRCRNNGATYAQISNYLDKITLKYRQ